jgi:PadR family transcriptional regulator PadR
MVSAPLPLVQGTVDLLVLRVLALEPMHGYGIASEVQRRTDGELVIPDAALYQSLHRLERQGLVDAEWAASENNRRARYYSLTPLGRKRLRDEAQNWRRYARAVDTLLQST